MISIPPPLAPSSSPAEMTEVQGLPTGWSRCFDHARALATVGGATLQLRLVDGRSMTDKNTVEIAAQCLARHDGHIVIFMALKPLGRHNNEIAKSRRIKTIMKLLRGRTSISLIELDLVTLIRERDGAGNYMLTDVWEVEGTKLAWLSDPMNQYLRLYEAVARQQHNTSRCTIRAVHAKGATVFLLGLINFDESAMLDLRSLADEVWQVAHYFRLHLTTCLSQ